MSRLRQGLAHAFYFDEFDLDAAVTVEGVCRGSDNNSGGGGSDPSFEGAPQVRRSDAACLSRCGQTSSSVWYSCPQHAHVDLRRPCWKQCKSFWWRSATSCGGSCGSGMLQPSPLSWLQRSAEEKAIAAAAPVGTWLKRSSCRRRRPDQGAATGLG